MAHSMTAFTRQHRETPWGTLSLELRSVNQRYLEPHFRLPETLRNLEPHYREKLRKAVARGKIECHLRFEQDDTAKSLTINHTRLETLAQTMEAIQRRLPQSSMPSTLALLDYPGVTASEGVDNDALHAEALALFDHAMTDFLEGRAREGERLAELIRERLTGIRAQVADVRAHLPAVLERQRQLILERLEQAKAELDPARLEAEMALLAQKSDVAEELDRLETHVDEVERQLTQKGPVGRRLDFLMQELNREANTLSSKAVVTDTTRCAVELKVLIEQMREQIQNME
ncbi:YicC/YloC family endoribonuclease [Larsenimonas suaedae]|uniref:YicC family protein n=1 Tax=Larsenimonas suaedae TaxID=1851019 RepID=A0ABU1GVZ8_9GAMM|nr:YicC/YloC family endoribonuclease [Larsenimonas suaedae]MCM2973335.1 YicC family protein [Larsenimonas suaedae]MDR5896228.1 YicC family protein [Larsenimonas suaedae]